nr:DUF6232 family protein [Streptomyces sp. SID11385]
MWVSQRLLGIDTAVYPLRNIVRVHTFRIRPDRNAAVLKFFQRLALLVVAVVLAAWGFGENSDGTRAVPGGVTVLVLGVVAYLLGDLLNVLFSRGHHVLTVETAGSARALLASRELDQLRDVVERISYAIEHPGAEFRMTIESFALNPRTYHYYGDSVNLHGDHNIGVKKA